jgi:hypothetical protein
VWEGFARAFPFRHLPCAFDAEGAETLGFFLVEIVLDEAVDAAAARTFAQAGAQFGEVRGRAGSHNFHIAILCVADPAAQVEFAGFAVDEPAEADALNATLDEEVKDHDQGQCGRCARAGATGGRQGTGNRLVS